MKFVMAKYCSFLHELVQIFAKQSRGFRSGFVSLTPRYWILRCTKPRIYN